MSHAAAPPRVAWAGALVFVFSDALIFLALLGAALSLRVDSREWSAGPLGSTAQLLVLSALLFGSSALLYGAGRRAPRPLLALAALTGTLFVGGELMEWRALASAGQGPASDLRHASLFVVTGLHAVHVAAGALVALWFGLRGSTRSALRVLSLYFGALDLAWVLIILVVYR